MICRMCRSENLYKFLDLGFMPPADEFLRKEQLRYPRAYYPLDVLMCRACGLSQLGYVVSPEILYRHDYPYEASTTRTGREHFAQFAGETVKRFGLGAKDLVIDVGSNVGVLLSNFKANGTRILGIDPAANIVRIAEKNGVPTLNELFSADLAAKIRGEHGKASVVTASNCFAHVNDLVDFVEALDVLLTPEGVFVMEAPHFQTLIENLEYDTIYHEHLSYLSLKPMIPFFKKHGLEVFDVEKQNIHGGSFRVFVGRPGKHKVTARVAAVLKGEAKAGLHSEKVLRKFAVEVEKNRAELLWLLRDLKHKGKTIVAVSAPAKGMTLLNYCKIGSETLDFVTEKSALKIDRFTPGSHIPVLPDSELLKRKPDYALLLAWNFAPEIMNNLKEYVKKGGRFIIPIPRPRVVQP
ncbi:MAG: class I SAM-dependent methyltransferase [Elusimicrobiota bacterium]|nr:class I SAM-dependent methyltransferase [Elusimicrobiota bacterium]